MSTQIWINVHADAKLAPASLPGMLVQYLPGNRQSVVRLDADAELLEDKNKPAGQQYSLHHQGAVTDLPWISSIAGIIRVKHRAGPRAYALKTKDVHNLLITSPGAKDFRLFANGAKRVAFSASRGTAAYHCGQRGRIELELLDGGTAFKFTSRLLDIQQEYILKTPSQLARAFRDFSCLCAMADNPHNNALALKE